MFWLENAELPAVNHLNLFNFEQFRDYCDARIN